MIARLLALSCFAFIAALTFNLGRWAPTPEEAVEITSFVIPLLAAAATFSASLIVIAVLAAAFNPTR